MKTKKRIQFEEDLKMRQRVIENPEELVADQHKLFMQTGYTASFIDA